MATLNPQIKRFIIQQLACFEPPSAVAEAVKAEFGVTITRQAVEHYDPTKGGEGKRLAGEHKELFEATRARFIREADAIGISHQVYRLAQLQRAADHAKSRNNWGLLLWMCWSGRRKRWVGLTPTSASTAARTARRSRCRLRCRKALSP